MDSHIKLILLDFDGTLVDTRQANYLAYAQALKEIGYNLTEKDYVSKYFGMRCSEFMASIGIEDIAERERLRERKIELYPTFFDSVKLNLPLWNFCQTFRTDNGVKVWIVSTGSRANIENVIEYLGLESDIDGIITGHDVPKSKPAPDCFLHVMEIEGVSPHQTVIFEDSAIGLEAARRSGAAYFKVQL